MKSIQFELFPDCQQGCKFCYCTNTKTSDETKIKSCNNALKFLNSIEIDNYAIVSIIGGEYLQDPYSIEVVKAFESVLDKLLELYLAGKLKGVWINATLTKPFNELTLKYLDLFNKVPYEKIDQAGFFICTSWDYIGRFHIEKQQLNWEYNMKFITENYPNVNKSAAIILTEHFMQLYLDNKFKLKEFSNKYGTSIFLKQPCGIDKDGYTIEPRKELNLLDKKEFNKYAGYEFYPHRETTLKFMYKLAQEEPEYLKDLFNISKRATDLVKYWDNGDGYLEHRYAQGNIEISGNVHINDCGHTYSYRSYSDCDACIRCDRNMVYQDATGESIVG